MAGVIGLCPLPFTLRELAHMAEAKVSEAWNHTSNMMAAMVCSMGGKAQPSDFHPDTQKRETANDIHEFFGDD